MINLPLNAGKVSSFNGVLTPLFEDPEFQEELQYYLLMTALISVPVMLLVKPLFLLVKTSKKKTNLNRQLSEGEEPLIESVQLLFCF